MNPIVEKTENNSSVSLICSTPIIETKNLQFLWYKNEQIITNKNADFEQILHKPFDDSKNSYFSSELKFKTYQRMLNGFYTCSLVFSADFYNITKNESLIFRPNCMNIIFILLKIFILILFFLKRWSFIYL